MIHVPGIPLEYNIAHTNGYIYWLDVHLSIASMYFAHRPPFCAIMNFHNSLSSPWMFFTHMNVPARSVSYGSYQHEGINLAIKHSLLTTKTGASPP